MKYLTVDSDNKILGWNEDASFEGCVETDSNMPEYTDTQSLYWEGGTVVAKDDNKKITIKTERIATQYARNRQKEYPSIQDLVVALYDTDDKADIEAKRAAVKAKYPKP